jgi:hypothetical protein
MEDVLFVVYLRAIQARIAAQRGDAASVSEGLEWLETTSRNIGQADYTLPCLATSALVRTELGDDRAAAALLAEIESDASTYESANYPAFLPAMVRAALATSDPELAQRLVAGVEPRTPYHEHALAAANATLAEAKGDVEKAAAGYADAAARWQAFGVVPEYAYALLGQGRCLLARGRTNEATTALTQAARIFQSLKAAPALGEIDTLLQQATALSS